MNATAQPGGKPSLYIEHTNAAYTQAMAKQTNLAIFWFLRVAGRGGLLLPEDAVASAVAPPVDPLVLVAPILLVSVIFSCTDAWFDKLSYKVGARNSIVVLVHTCTTSNLGAVGISLCEIERNVDPSV